MTATWRSDRDAKSVRWTPNFVRRDAEETWADTRRVDAARAVDAVTLKADHPAIGIHDYQFWGEPGGVPGREYDFVAPRAIGKVFNLEPDDVRIVPIAV